MKKERGIYTMAQRVGKPCSPLVLVVGTNYDPNHRLRPRVEADSNKENGRRALTSNCFVSLFSGAGGLDLGLEVAGWRGLYAADIDPAAVATLQRNQGRSVSGIRFMEDAVIEAADVQTLTGQKILDKIGAGRGEIPLLVGGPPCQSWSSAGRQKGFEDPRGRLFADFVRLASELDVRWLMFENVRGLLTARGPDGRPGSALELIRKQLLAAGFQTAVQLVNAADYGVGQRRVRLIVFGYRAGEALDFPKPTHDKQAQTGKSSMRPWVTLDDVLRSVPAPSPDEVIRPSGLLAHQMRDLLPGSGVKSPGKAETTRPGGHWGYKQGAFVTDPSKPARTVTASGQQDWLRDPELGLRKLSPRECAAIQSFPQNWEFAGKRNDHYRLIGNAVPPELGRVLGRALLRHAGKDHFAPIGQGNLIPLPVRLASAIRYTEREEARNGESRRAAPDRRAKKVA
jgi:DNA (cytosine-5)-methyltransferase 1